MKNVVVTGLGLVTPLANSSAQTFKLLAENGSGIRRACHSLFQLSSDQNYNVAMVRDFPYKDYRAAHADNRMTSFLLKAAEQAIQQSRLSDLSDCGLSLGLMSSNTTSSAKIAEDTMRKGYQHISRLSMLQILSNIPAAVLSIKHGLRGPTQTIATACASSASAILDGYHRIAYGEVPAMLVGGAQDISNPTVLHSSAKLGAMSTKLYQRPEESSRPFERDRSGFILGQGAGILLLQQEQSARARGATIVARILGGATTSDGFHLTRPADKGEGLRRAMLKALSLSRVSASRIDLFNCHATSTPAGDQLELAAIDSLCSDSAMALSLKGHLGHTFGAAGVVETALGIIMCRNEMMVGTRNLDNALESRVKLVKGLQKRKVEYWIKNSMGFGGINVSLVLQNV